MEGDLYIFQQNVTLNAQLLLLHCATYLKLIPPASGGHPHRHLQTFVSLAPCPGHHLWPWKSRLMLLLLGGDNGNLSVALGKKGCFHGTRPIHQDPTNAVFTFTYIMGLGEPRWSCSHSRRWKTRTSPCPSLLIESLLLPA